MLQNLKNVFLAASICTLITDWLSVRHQLDQTQVMYFYIP